MNFKKKLSNVYRILFNRAPSLIESSLCGIELKTLPGTIRKTPDQDDAWFFYLAKNNNVIFDIGANVGYTALLALIQNPNRDYLLVDPNPLALQNAHYNLLTNNLGFKSRYYAAFVSNKNNESVNFYTVGAGAAGSIHKSHATTAAASNSFTKVATVTLDYLYTYYNIKPNLVKIDVEGAETLVMEGAKKLAKETNCLFFIEMHDVESLRMEDATNLIISWAIEMYYNVWYLKTGSLLTTSEEVKNRGKCHLLLQPKEEPYPTYLKNVSQGARLPNIS